VVKAVLRARPSLVSLAILRPNDEALVPYDPLVAAAAATTRTASHSSVVTPQEHQGIRGMPMTNLLPHAVDDERVMMSNQERRLSLLPHPDSRPSLLPHHDSRPSLLPHPDTHSHHLLAPPVPLASTLSRPTSLTAWDLESGRTAAQTQAHLPAQPAVMQQIAGSLSRSESLTAWDLESGRTAAEVQAQPRPHRGLPSHAPNTVPLNASFAPPAPPAVTDLGALGRAHLDSLLEARLRSRLPSRTASMHGPRATAAHAAHGDMDGASDSLRGVRSDGKRSPAEDDSGFTRSPVLPRASTVHVPPASSLPIAYHPSTHTSALYPGASGPPLALPGPPEWDAVYAASELDLGTAMEPPTLLANSVVIPPADNVVSNALQAAWACPVAPYQPPLPTPSQASLSHSQSSRAPPTFSSLLSSRGGSGTSVAPTVPTHASLASSSAAKLTIQTPSVPPALRPAWSNQASSHSLLSGSSFSGLFDESTAARPVATANASRIVEKTPVALLTAALADSHSSKLSRESSRRIFQGRRAPAPGSSSTLGSSQDSDALEADMTNIFAELACIRNRADCV
jgi:hypothetical protein